MAMVLYIDIYTDIDIAECSAYRAIVVRRRMFIVLRIVQVKTLIGLHRIRNGSDRSILRSDRTIVRSGILYHRYIRAG